MAQRRKRKRTRYDNQQRIAGDFSLKYLLEIIIRRKRVIPPLVILTPLVAVLLSFLISPSYMSTTTIILRKSEILNPLVRYETAVSLTDWDRLRLFRKIIYSRPLIEELLHRLELDADVTSDQEMEWRVNEIRANIRLMNISADSFQIGCTATDPVIARDMVATISELFIEKSLEGSRREASVAVDFIQTQLDHYENTLTDAEAALRDFKREHMDRLRSMASVRGDLEMYKQKLMGAQLELRQEKLTIDLLEERLAGEKPMVVAQALFVQNTPYKRRYQELKMEMGQLLSSRKPDHPDVIELQRQLDYIVELLEKEKKNREAAETRKVRSPVYQEILARTEDTHIRARVGRISLLTVLRQEMQVGRAMGRPCGPVVGSA